MYINKNPSYAYQYAATNPSRATKKQWPEDNLPPPDISQNHYRHIHEQRDFTLENLSMAGETEMLEYDDYKIQAEFEWNLDLDIQDMILTQRRHSSSGKTQQEDFFDKQLLTDTEQDTTSSGMNKPSQRS